MFTVYDTVYKVAILDFMATSTHDIKNFIQAKIYNNKSKGRLSDKFEVKRSVLNSLVLVW